MTIKIKQTRLYIKRHKVTGLMYFGKTVKEDINSYKGSGKHWKSHIKEHGVDLVETIWVSDPFINKNDIIEFATLFSELFDIVNSSQWANLTVENGIDGGDSGVYPHWLIGHIDSEQTKKKRSESLKGINNGMYGKTGELNPFYGKSHSQETLMKLKKPKTEEAKKKYREASRPITECPHCGKIGQVSIMKRWHFDNCKNS
jgi:hypothetical protein